VKSVKPIDELTKKRKANEFENSKKETKNHSKKIPVKTGKIIRGTSKK